ncbi:MAG TPA: CDP-archaeol synthase [Dehalococcoidales bacterium]|nr:CDP-archaeol synthase [Dehalococcoidales bacterium]
MLKARVITAVWAVPVVLASIWFSRPEYVFPLFTVVAAVAGLLGVYEFYKVTGVVKNSPLFIFGLLWTTLFIIRPHYGYTDSLPVLLSGGLVLSLAMLVFIPKREGLFSQWAWMTGGALYVGWLLGLLVNLRLLPDGRNWLYMALIATFASDTLAYFIGKAFGKNKMSPAISPGKTWEGAVAGVFGALIISILFTLKTPLQVPLKISESIILGFFISVFGQIGDLAESLLKRNTGVKDSGSLMKGHGGILDRIDSILFASAVVYFFVLMLK